ncbi:MAG: hypothetical protein U1E76_12455 [Planctomycetota bacterium]
MKTMQATLVLLALTVLSTVALALEPPPGLRLSISRLAGDCRLKLHGAPANARTTLICVDEHQRVQLADWLSCDAAGRAEASIASLPFLQNLDGIPNEGRMLKLQVLVQDTSSNEVQLVCYPPSVVVTSEGDDGKSALQWFSSTAEIGSLPVEGAPRRVVYTPDHTRLFVLTDAPRGHVICFDGLTHRELGRWLAGELGVDIVDLLVSADGMRLLALSRGRSDRFQRVSRGRLSIMDIPSLQVQEPGVPVDLAPGQSARIVEDDETPWRVFVVQASMQIAQINLFQRYREDLINVDAVADDAIQEDVRDLVVLNRTLFVATAGRSSSGALVGALAWFEKGTREHGHIALPGAPIQIRTGTAPDGKPAIFLLLEHDALVLLVDPATKGEIGRLAIPPGAHQLALSEAYHLGLLLYPHGNDGAGPEALLRFFDATGLDLLAGELALGATALDQQPLLDGTGAAVILVLDQNVARVVDLDTRGFRSDLVLRGRGTSAAER